MPFPKLPHQYDDSCFQLLEAVEAKMETADDEPALFSLQFATKSEATSFRVKIYSFVKAFTTELNKPQEKRDPMTAALLSHERALRYMTNIKICLEGRNLRFVKRNYYKGMENLGPQLDAIIAEAQENQVDFTDALHEARELTGASEPPVKSREELEDVPGTPYAENVVIADEEEPLYPPSIVVDNDEENQNG